MNPPKAFKAHEDGERGELRLTHTGSAYKVYIDEYYFPALIKYLLLRKRL